MADPGGDRAADLRATERRRLRALVEGDLAVAHELHADDYQLVTPGGGTMSKDAYLGDIASGVIEYRVFEPASEVAVQVFGDGGAVRYQARIDIRFASGGHDLALVWHTDLYRWTDGRWQAVWSQATRIPTRDAGG
ncbi:MAG TPA: nuclear transport factor 2 family protein [Candidatus Limnocylindrales bacterium]|nr:nuclear transport factor 2 family protein [Candidatus Limnocylindrales bacterium]